MNLKTEEFIEHIKTLNIGELKEKYDGIMRVCNAYKDDPLLRLFNPESYDEMVLRNKIVKDELDKRIEEELLGD